MFGTFIGRDPLQPLTSVMLSLTGMVITVVFKTFLIKGLNSVNHANRSRACRQEAAERGSWDRGSWAVDRGSIVGTIVMAALVPLPAKVASLMRGVQKQRMEAVCTLL